MSVSLCYFYVSFLCVILYVVIFLFCMFFCFFWPFIFLGFVFCCVFSDINFRNMGFRTLRSLLGQGFNRSEENNRLTGVYELMLKKCTESGSPGLLHAPSLVSALFACISICVCVYVVEIVRIIKSSLLLYHMNKYIRYY